MDRIFLKGCNGAPVGLFPEEDGKLDLRVFEFRPLSISLNSQPGLTDDRGFTKRTAAAVLSLLGGGGLGSESNPLTISGELLLSGIVPQTVRYFLNGIA